MLLFEPNAHVYGLMHVVLYPHMYTCLAAVVTQFTIACPIDQTNNIGKSSILSEGTRHPS